MDKRKDPKGSNQFSQFDYIPETAESQLLEIFNKVKNPLDRETLSVITQMSDRAVRNAIRRMREKGIPIIACPAGGYYLAHEDSEVQKLIADYYSRAHSMMRTAKALQHNYEMKGQMKI